MTYLLDDEALRRWRLVLGGGEADGTHQPLSQHDSALDAALEGLYDSERGAGLGDSAPNLARWLGDIRKYFDTPLVRILQRDAIERLDLKQLLLEPELMQAAEPDVHLVATLLSLSDAMPEQTRETARMVVRQVVQELEKRLSAPLRQAVQGSLQRSARNRRPRLREMDWHKTIRANLKHYQPQYNSIIPEQRYGSGHRTSALRDVILCVDQSGSMASSVVYASIYSAVMASMPALKTQMVLFDTAVVDMTENLRDPVDILFGAQLGGGTDIARAIAYCQSQIKRPQDTILVLISDLYEGGDRGDLLARVAHLVDSGVQVVTILALNDEGAPAYDDELSAAFAGLGVPSFACTPDVFPDLMAAAIGRQDMSQWAHSQGLVTR